MDSLKNLTRLFFPGVIDISKICFTTRQRRFSALVLHNSQEKTVQFYFLQPWSTDKTHVIVYEVDREERMVKVRELLGDEWALL